MIYLACPYSDPDPAVRRDRFLKANKQAALFMSEGLHVFSPISHCHPIARQGDLPTNWKYWKAYDKKILSICSELCVLTIPGWKKSKGVRGEMEIAVALDLSITLVRMGNPIRVPFEMAFAVGLVTQ